MRSSKNQKGFTMVETIVVVALFTMLIYGVTFLVASMFRANTFQTRLLDNNDQARKVATNFTNELRNAIYSANGNYPLEIAQTQQIAFYTLSGNTVIRVRYYLSSGRLYRGVVMPSGNPPVYNLGTETAVAVQNAMATQGGDTIFSYFDGDYNGTGTALTQPVNPTAVKHVKIDLKIYRQGSKNNIGTYNVTAGGSIRNLKTNL